MLVGGVPIMLLQLEKVLEMHIPPIWRPKYQSFSSRCPPDTKLSKH